MFLPFSGFLRWTRARKKAWGFSLLKIAGQAAPQHLFGAARLYINYDQEHTFIRTSESSFSPFKKKLLFRGKKYLIKSFSFYKIFVWVLHYLKTLKAIPL